MRRMYMCSAMAVAVTLSGCQGFRENIRPDIAAKPVPSRLDEIAYINVLRSAFVQIPMTDEEKQQIKAKKEPAVEPLEKLLKVQANKVSAEPKATAPTQGYYPVTAALCYNGNSLSHFVSPLAEGKALTNGNENYIGEKGPKGQKLCITYKPYTRPDFEDENFAKDPKLAEMQNYLAAGFGLTDMYCERFFTVASASAQNRQFYRDASTGVDAMVGTILNLSGVGSTATGIVNSGFGLIGDGLQAYDAAYLVAPDLGAVRKLIQAEQATYRQTYFAGTAQEYEKYFPRNYAAARTVIERYAGMCSFSGMRQLINDSLATATEEAKQKLQFPASPPTPSAVRLLNELKTKAEAGQKATPEELGALEQIVNPNDGEAQPTGNNQLERQTTIVAPIG